MCYLQGVGLAVFHIVVRLRGDKAHSEKQNYKETSCVQEVFRNGWKIGGGEGKELECG